MSLLKSHYLVRNLIIFIGLLSIGCSTNNIYKKVTFQKPPLVPAYVHMTRESQIDAGVEPVESGEVLVTEDTVYVASETQGIEAYERPYFIRKWNFPVKNGVTSKLLLEGNSLYFGGEDGYFYSIDAEFGKLNWKFETKAPVFARATTSGGKIFISTSDDLLYCLDKSNGKWVWHYKRSGNYITTIRGNSSAAIADGLVYVGFSDGYLVALKQTDGNLQWESKVHYGSKFTDVDAKPIIEENRIYISSYDGALYVIDRKNGKVIWKVDIGATREVVLEDKLIFTSGTDGYVYSLNKESGKILWKFELDRGVPTGLVFYQNYIAFGSSQQYFYVIHKGDGTLAYRFDAGLRSGFVSNPVLNKDMIYTLSNYGNIYTFKWKTSYHNKYYSFQ